MDIFDCFFEKEHILRAHQQKRGTSSKNFGGCSVLLVQLASMNVFILCNDRKALLKFFVNIVFSTAMLLSLEEVF